MNSSKIITIIIADDHPVFRNGLINIISKESDIKILGDADNGEKAYDMIQDLKPDIALLDIHMPKLTGLQILKNFVEL